MYRPQARRTVRITDGGNSDNASKIVAISLSVCIALLTRFSAQRKTYSIAMYATVVSLMASIPLNVTRPGVALVFSLGCWLFLSQVFISTMKGELIKQMSSEFQERIRYVDACDSPLRIIEHGPDAVIAQIIELPEWAREGACEISGRMGQRIDWLASW